MMPIPQAFDLAFQHHQAGRLAEAEALYRQILAVQPRHADALHFLGVVAHQVGRHETAVELIRESIAANPSNYASHSNLGEAYRALRRFDEALASHQMALRLSPENAGAYFNLGNTWNNLGRLDEAMAAYRRAIEVAPGFPQASVNLGTLLYDRGEMPEAIAVYQHALQYHPDFAPALNNLGNALLGLSRFDEAIAVYHRTLALDPLCAEAHNNLGLALIAQGELDAACAAHRRSIEIRPDYAMAHSNLGNALKDSGQLEEAIAAYRRAVEFQPGTAGMHSNLIYALHFQPDETIIAAEQRRWNQKFSDPLPRPAIFHPNARDPERRLRIGYVSPDFRDHVVGRNLWPLFRGHHRAEFEIVCYSGVSLPDAMTGEFQRHADRWRRTVGLPDLALAELIRQDGVDILVDLTQHMAYNRLPVFAHRPAPVQVSFAGYPATAGVDAIEHRLSDRWLEAEAPEIGDRSPEMGRRSGAELRTPNSDLRSPNPELRPAERVFFLDSFWCYDPLGLDIPINTLPASERGHVTFGSLNNFCKINDAVLALWSRILAQLPESRLLLLSLRGEHRPRVTQFFAGLGISPDRVEFLEPRARRDYLELYHRLDIVLDPFPYGGHTTSLDALWMGVPVVSLAGPQSVSRAGLSQMSNLGLPELAAFSEDEYLAIATGLARDLPRLAELRRTLRSRMAASPLMDAPNFVRQIEAAYRAMWRRWCTEAPS